MTIEHVTTSTAVGAATSPWWLPGLQAVSDACAIALPILGVSWLLFQFTLKIRSLLK
jgi:hypothetical protein